MLKCERAAKRSRPMDGVEESGSAAKRPSPGYSAHMKNMAHVEKIREDLTPTTIHLNSFMCGLT